MTDQDPLLAAWVADFVEEVRRPDQVELWVARTVEAIRVAVPETAEFADELAVVVRDQWLAFVDRLGDERPFELPPSARELALELARRHLSLPTLLTIYRAAQQASWDYAIAVVRGAPAEIDHEALLVEFWGRAGAWLDASVEESVVLHQAEARRIEQRGDAQRFQLVAAVLDGEDHDPVTLSAALGGYPLNQAHVALVLHALTPDGIGHLEPCARRLAGRHRTVVVRPGGRELWCWTAPHEHDLTGLDPALVRVSLGGPASGLAGFVAAHREARAALPVALAHPRPLTRYDDVAALTVLTADHAAARRFAERTLGDLTDPQADRLRETVRAVLTTPGGAEAAARRLGVHKNTVRYRVAAAERALGGRLQERVGDLVLALDYYETFMREHPSER